MEEEGPREEEQDRFIISFVCLFSLFPLPLLHIQSAAASLSASQVFER